MGIQLSWRFILELELNNPEFYGLLLWILLGLFIMRVIGQLSVVLFHPSWLPPMSQWFSGLIPYKRLFLIQVIFIIAMSSIALSFTTSQGPLIIPRPGAGKVMLAVSYIYFTSMIIRYIVRMWRNPDQRWLGGTIPIVFHFVLAAYILVLGSYHAQ